MPTYEIEIPGQGKYRVESDNELSDDQVYQEAMANAEPSPAAEPSAEPGTYEKYFGSADTPDANFLTKFGGITGRRTGAAIDAAIDLPSSIGDIFTGGRDGRLAALLKTVQGLASPISIALSPIEAAGEEAVRGITGSEQLGRLGGDLTGLASTFGLGLLSKAGKLGEGAENVAKFLGVGRPKTFEEMVARDPQLAFVAEKGQTVGPTNLELAARRGESMADLAMQLDNPEMAKVALHQMNSDGQLWQEWAKQNKIISEMPEEPMIDLGKVLVDGSKRDFNVLDNLGTTATRASSLNRQAGNIGYETQLAELGINQAVENRTARVKQAMEGLSDGDVRAGVLTRDLLDAEQLANAPESRVTSAVKQFAQFLNDKFNVDKNIAIPRMRDKIRDRIATAVKNEMGDSATESEMVSEVNRRILKAVPDNAGVDQMVLQLFPGLYKVTDGKGNVLRTADTGLGWKQEVYDLVKNGYDPKQLKVEAQAYLDSDLLQAYKGRTKRAINHVANGLTPDAEDILAASRGEFMTQKIDNSTNRVWSLFNSMKGESGNAKGYANDLQGMLATYDRSFERWLQVNDLYEKINPTLKEIAKRQPELANNLKANIGALWGHRMPGSAGLDNLIAATPLLRDWASPMLMERWAQAGKSALVEALLRYNPRFHAVNSTQTLATLWPIADANEILQGIKLRSSEAGKALMDRHGVTGAGSKIEGLRKSLGPTEVFNQETAWATMYNRARKFGLSDAQAADYGKLRGQVYSQFMGLTTDQPLAFRKLDPSGMFTMFQRFPVKQAELMMDLIKNKDFPGAAKWLGVNLALGGMKSATLGQAGWLTYKVYKDIEEKYGKGLADVVHTGLPALLGADISGSVQAFNPPFGETWGERLGNFAAGPFLGLANSTMRAAFDNAAVDPSVTSRVLRSITQRNPITKGLWQLFGEDDKYNFRDTGGRMKWKGDMSDLIKTSLGFKPSGGQMGNYDINDPHQMKAGEIDTFVDALMEATQKRDDVIDYAASRYGQAQASGIDLGKDLQDAVEREVDKWNNLWPEFPITGDDIMQRAKRRSQSIMQGTAQRILNSTPRAIKNSDVFQATPSTGSEESVPQLPKLPFEFFGGG